MLIGWIEYSTILWTNHKGYKEKKLIKFVQVCCATFPKPHCDWLSVNISWCQPPIRDGFRRPIVCRALMWWKLNYSVSIQSLKGTSCLRRSKLTFCYFLNGCSFISILMQKFLKIIWKGTSCLKRSKLTFCYFLNGCSFISILMQNF